MKIDVSLYTYSLPSLVAITKANSNLPIKDIIALAAATTHIPVLACAYLIGNEVGYTQDVLDTIASTTKYYKYTQIEGLHVCPNLK